MATLYAARGTSLTTSDLYTVDPVSGVCTSVGAIGFAVTGLAFDPTDGTLYGATSGNSASHPKSLITIDPATGAGTFIGAFGSQMSDLACDASGNLYGFCVTPAATLGLHSIDKATAAATAISGPGVIGTAAGGIAFDTGGTLWWLNNDADNIYSLDPGTGVATTVAAISGYTPGNVITAASFTSGNQVWVSERTTGSPPSVDLVTVTTPAGVSSFVVTLSVTGVDALAWTPPAPVALEGRVLIAFDDGPLVEHPTWTPIDTIPDLVSGYDIHAGRQTEQDQTDASTAIVYLNDTQGLFDPANTSSPYYGKLDGKQIWLRLYNPVTATWVSQYRGFIDDYGYDLHESQVVSNIQISCTDWFDFLGGVEMIPGLFGDMPPTGSEGVVFYEDTDFQTRLVQLASTDAGVPAGRTRFFTGNVNVQETKYDPGDSILMGLRDTVDAEFPGVANLFVDKRGILAAHGRFARFDPDGVSFGTDWDFRRWKAGDGDAIALDSDRAQIRPPLNWTRPRSLIINAAIAWPRYPLNGAGGGTFVASDIPDQIALDSTSVTDFGYHAKPPMGDLITLRGFTTGNDAKAETKLYATFYVDNYSQPRTRVESLTFKSLPPDDPRAPATWGLICGADISDVINLAVGYPGGVGLAAEDWYVEGYDLQVRPLRDYDLVEARYNISPTAYYDTNPFT